jgi:hypothetical protein
MSRVLVGQHLRLYLEAMRNVGLRVRDHRSALHIRCEVPVVQAIDDVNGVANIQHSDVARIDPGQFPCVDSARVAPVMREFNGAPVAGDSEARSTDLLSLGSRVGTTVTA